MKHEVLHFSTFNLLDVNDIHYRYCGSSLGVGLPRGGGHAENG